MKKKIYDWVYIILIISVILFLMWIVYFLKGEAKECLSQPMDYYSKKTNTQCYCIDYSFIDKMVEEKGERYINK